MFEAYLAEHSLEMELFKKLEKKYNVCLIWMRMRVRTRTPRRGLPHTHTPHTPHTPGESWSVGSDRTHQTPPTHGHQPDPSTKPNHRRGPL